MRFFESGSVLRRYPRQPVPLFNELKPELDFISNSGFLISSRTYLLNEQGKIPCSLVRIEHCVLAIF